MRASDTERQFIAEVLREQHLAGRLDTDELDQRLGLCLAAKTYSELRALTVDLPCGERRPPLLAAKTDLAATTRPRRASIRGVMRVLHRLALFFSVLLLPVWALSGHGYFWPKWVWLGVAFPFGLLATVRWAWGRPPGTQRRAIVIWALFGYLEAMFVVVWLLTAFHRSYGFCLGENCASPAPYFWPAWTLLAFVMVAGGYSVLALGASASLAASLSARTEALIRSRQRTANAEAVELGRIERDLHDGAQARLVALTMQLGRAELELEDQPATRQLIEDAHEEARRAIADLRSLARGIAPPLLSDRGLAVAASDLAVRCGAQLRVDPALNSRRLEPSLERGAYLVLAEALTNAAKHADADRVFVRLAMAHGELLVRVADDGRGGAAPAGSGLSGLRDRVEALGGMLTIASPSGEGTTLEARFPAGS